jgi:hypothetical protein
MGLEVLEFIADVEKALGIEVPDQDIATIATPRQFVAYLCDRVRVASPTVVSGTSRWTKAEIEAVVEGFIAKTARNRGGFTLDTPFRDIFP